MGTRWILFKIAIVLICFDLSCDANQHKADVSLDLDKKILEGEKYYIEITKKTFTYGDCWKKAVSDLEVGCKDLTQDVQSRLALSFANCFLEYSGSETCSCPREMTISSCLRNVSERVFATYREFFTHTQSICYFLQHKLWQEETAKTVEKLTINSEEVGKKLEESSKQQSLILTLQHEAVQEQQKLISNGRVLNMELDKSRTHAQLVFEEFKSSTNEQRMMIFEVFDRIRKLQTLVLGEFTGVYSFVYYLAASVFVYILTSTPYTSGARIWLFLLMTANAILERIISASCIDEETEKYSPLESDGPIYHKIWLCRKISSAFSFCILIFFSLRYKDYNVINNKLLRELQQQNSEIQFFIKNMKKNTSELVADTTHVTIKEQSFCEEQILKHPAEPINTSQPDLLIVAATSPSQNVVSSKNYSSEKKTSTIKRRKSKQTADDTSQNESMLELLASPPGRYNLRSRTNSPAQGRFMLKSPETLCNEIKESLETSLKNKAAIKKKLKKDKI